MSTKKVAQKKTIAKAAPVVKKAVAKKSVAKDAPVAKKGKATPVIKRSEVTLVSFSVTAVIPTQQYGNIQPTIQVNAPTIEEARAMVMPVIENFYETYAELPLNGKPVKFLAKVTESHKVVNIEPEKAPTAAPVVTPAATTAPKVEPEATGSSAAASVPSSSESIPQTTTERPEAFKKAEKAISLAASHDALAAIEAQIQSSIKINPDDKPELYKILNEKRNSIPF